MLLAIVALLVAVLAVGVYYQVRSNDPPTQACARQAAALAAPGTRTEMTVSPTYAPSPFVTGALWTPPYAGAEEAAQDADRSGDFAEAARFRRIVATPRAVWFADAGLTGSDLTSAVAGTVGPAIAQGQVPVLVAYAIPLRDCGGESAGGTSTAPVLRRSTSSRTRSRCSARTETCCFSHDTLVMRLPSRACRKNARSPGCPKVPATNRSGSS